MLFNSYAFLFGFLPLVTVAYFALPAHRLRLLLVIAASYFFYAYAKWWFPALIGGSTAIGFLGGRVLERTSDTTRRKLVLGVNGCAPPRPARSFQVRGLHRREPDGLRIGHNDTPWIRPGGSAKQLGRNLDAILSRIHAPF